LLATGGKDKIIRLWDVRSRQQVNKGFKGHMDTVTSLCIDPDGEILFSGSKDRSLKQWNIRAMLYVDSMYGHTDNVNEIISYSKQRVISVGADN
jgi:ribosomal RNA-processing protein 9